MSPKVTPRSSTQRTRLRCVELLRFLGTTRLSEELQKIPTLSARTSIKSGFYGILDFAWMPFSFAASAPCGQSATASAWQASWLGARWAYVITTDRFRPLWVP